MIKLHFINEYSYFTEIKLLNSILLMENWFYGMVNQKMVDGMVIMN